MQSQTSTAAAADKIGSADETKLLLSEISRLVLKPQKEQAIQKAYSDCFILLTRHYYDSGCAKNRAQLVATYKDLLNKFLSGRVLAGSGLNIRFLQTVFEQCPALAWDLHEVILKCFLASQTSATSKDP